MCFLSVVVVLLCFLFCFSLLLLCCSFLGLTLSDYCYLFFDIVVVDVNIFFFFLSSELKIDQHHFTHSSMFVVFVSYSTFSVPNLSRIVREMTALAESDLRQFACMLWSGNRLAIVANSHKARIPMSA